MIKNTLLLIGLFVSIAASAQFTVTIQWHNIKPGINSDTIYYEPGKKLAWKDFKGRPVAASPAAAITESGFGYRMTMNSRNKKTNVVITVFCYFTKHNSWVKRGMASDYALKHEQHHFDITYINAWLFMQKLKEAQFNPGNYNYLAEKIHDECFEALSKMQDDYDGETSNGRINHMQYTWNRKIDKQLAELVTD